MTSRVLVRQARPDEAGAVADVLIASRRAAYPEVPASVHADGETRTWVRDHLMPVASVWVGSAADDRLVAVLALRDGWVDQLYVLAEWSGQGIGSRLLEEAKQQSPAGLQLWTFVSNVPARGFYERHGFVVAEQTDGSGNEEREPDLRMVWRP